jgi:hypothetical protein
MGAALIKKEVLEKMEHPWFRHMIIDLGDVAEEIGEDFSFCVGAKQAGYKIYCDASNRAAHIDH